MSGKTDAKGALPQLPRAERGRRFTFGQPPGALYMVAYVVKDMDRAIALHSRLQVAPWFVAQYKASPEARYKGQKTEIAVTLARGYAGNMPVELIHQADDTPSVFRDMVRKQGYGFHHWGIATSEFDRDFAFYKDQGYEMPFIDAIPGRHRIAFFDTTADMGGYIKIAEINEAHDRFLTAMKRAAEDFDGTEPVRHRSPV